MNDKEVSNEIVKGDPKEKNKVISEGHRRYYGRNMPVQKYLSRFLSSGKVVDYPGVNHKDKRGTNKGVQGVKKKDEVPVVKVHNQFDALDTVEESDHIDNNNEAKNNDEQQQQNCDGYQTHSRNDQGRIEVVDYPGVNDKDKKGTNKGVQGVKKKDEVPVVKVHNQFDALDTVEESDHIDNNNEAKNNDEQQQQNCDGYQTHSRNDQGRIEVSNEIVKRDPKEKNKVISERHRRYYGRNMPVQKYLSRFLSSGKVVDYPGVNDKDKKGTNKGVQGVKKKDEVPVVKVHNQFDALDTVEESDHIDNNNEAKNNDEQQQQNCDGYQTHSRNDQGRIEGVKKKDEVPVVKKKDEVPVVKVHNQFDALDIVEESDHIDNNNVAKNNDEQQQQNCDGYQTHSRNYQGRIEGSSTKQWVEQYIESL
ncbi:hypothetical protein K7X08_000811 [Anisodus acutangulus]|uniref:Uncharacterized protein n=1 Tax=Anisodus acutangulus TaxID=402998 RepID=A0A9Q1LMM6_9SOLA|nr:hypothetical protein K7X08_000811 [Anisodus acutangulus]